MTVALASTALASPALARDKAWYVGVEGGAMIVEDIDYNVNGAATTLTGTTTIDHNYGYDVDGVIGYDFGAFRLEAEVGYRSATVDGIRSSGRIPFGPAAGQTVAAGNYDYAGGKSSALSFMINGLLDFGPDDGLQGFVGGMLRERVGHAPQALR